MSEKNDDLFFWVYDVLNSRTKLAMKVTGMMIEVDENFIHSLFDLESKEELNVCVEICCSVLFSSLFGGVTNDDEFLGKDFTLSVMEWYL